MSEHVVSDFNGRDDLLIMSIDSLLEMDAKGILVPHGIGGHARTLLRAAKASIQAKPTPPAPTPNLSRPDCSTCANRGRVDGLSQETHCSHCCWRDSWRTDHYQKKD